MGNEQGGHIGIIPKTVYGIFDIIENTPDPEFLLSVSYMEIYKENVTDLLSNKTVPLKIQDGDVNGLQEYIVKKPTEILNLLKEGEKRRRTGTTNMNKKSSRSHTIFQMIIESCECSSDGNAAVNMSQFNLVELAESEGVRDTGATGDWIGLHEEIKINKSLLTLGLVIWNLSKGQESLRVGQSALRTSLQ